MPHYRDAVWTHLTDLDVDWTFVCAEPNPEPTIKRWTPPPTVQTRTWRAWWIRGVLVHPGVVWEGLRPGTDVLILGGNAWRPATWCAAIAGRVTGKRVLMWTHAWTRTETGLKALFRRTFYKLANGLLCYGHAGKCWGIAQGLDPSRLHVVYNSLNYPLQRQERAKVTREELVALRTKVMGRADRPIAVCSSRLIPVRRLDLLIEAAAQLKQRGASSEVDLLIIGDGPERAALETLARQRGVHCVFYGACYEEAVLSRLIMMSNCMVAPGKVGLTSLHALAYGTPVVTHNNAENQMPEWEAIIPGVTGSTFTDENVGELATAIAQWCADAWPSESVRAECHRVVDRFWNPFVQREIVRRALVGEPADDLWFLRSDVLAAQVARGDAPFPDSTRPGSSAQCSGR
ncbi:MAG: glycosyltransferase family 4 protein [Phycisphaerales bacterium]|jgi:glycosyltransferase involved in cell wall biosynthesis|nr:glycosyltransferase family 4 protein [Phycisphaerales bacterium]